MGRIVGIILVAALSIAGVTTALSDPAQPSGVPSEDSMKVLALRWFAQIQAGKIDRTQYTAAYGAQLTDDAVQELSRKFNQYGAAPLRAEIMQKRTIDDQIFYQVKLVFPRGDAASLVFGFDTEGKITGVVVMSLAGD